MSGFIEIFQTLSQKTLPSVLVKDDNTIEITGLNGQYRRYVIYTGLLEEARVLHPRFPEALVLSRNAYKANQISPRSELYLDEVQAILDNLMYGTFSIKDISGAKHTCSRIRSIELNKRKANDAQSFRVFLEKPFTKSKKVGGTPTPFIVHTSNSIVDVYATELDRVFPAWTTRYIEMKKLGETQDLMSYVFNPHEVLNYNNSRNNNQPLTKDETHSQPLSLPGNF